MQSLLESMASRTNGRFWYAGERRWLDCVGLNVHAIGIELDNYGILDGAPGHWTAFRNVWARLKEWRAVATGYETTAKSFLGILCLAATADWTKLKQGKRPVWGALPAWSASVRVDWSGGGWANETLTSELKMFSEREVEVLTAPERRRRRSTEQKLGPDPEN